LTEYSVGTVQSFMKLLKYVGLYMQQID